jgi:hypothetical protein
LARSIVQKLRQHFDADAIDSLTLMGSLFSGLYAAVLASLLGIFVPQMCPPTDAMPEPHVCSLTENFQPESQLNGVVLAVNVITLLAVLAGQGFLGYREYWVIQAFDFDDLLPNENLVSEVRLYPSFAATLVVLNRRARLAAFGMLFLVSLNVLLSAIHCLHDFSAGKASAAALISYTMLLAPRVLGWAINSQRAYSSGAPISLFIKTPALPNTIDADFKYKPEVYKPHYVSSMADNGAGANVAAAPQRGGASSRAVTSGLAAAPGAASAWAAEESFELLAAVVG